MGSQSELVPIKKMSILKNANIRTYTMIFALLIIILLFTILTNGTFFSPRNLSMLFRAMSISGVITAPTVLLIVSGNFDLAVGSVVALTSGVAAALQVWFGVNTPMAIAIALLIGVAIGLWQGFWVAYRKVPSFIVSLGNMMAVRGIFLVITAGITITPLHADFSAISQSYIPGIWNYVIGAVAIVAIILFTLRGRASRIKYGFKIDAKWLTSIKMIGGVALVVVFVALMMGFRGIPIPVIILIGTVLVFTFIAQKTRFGRRVYAIGGNREAAKLSGINVNRHILSVFVMTGVLSAVSGIMLASRMDGAVSAAGTGFEMDVISACVIGGTSLSGGKGTIFGALIGALIIASLDNGMSLLNVTYYTQSIVKGLVLILAVWFDVATQERA
jgi:D-xylose transport system permease protein